VECGAAVAADEVAGGEDKRRKRNKCGGTEMKAITNKLVESRPLLSACLVAFCVLGSGANAQPRAKVKGTTSAAAVKRFATSQQAATALIEAAERFDVGALVAIMGPANADLVITADTVQDKQRATTFAAKAREKTSVTEDPKNSSRAVLSVGNDEWPYPVPIVKGRGGWFFDARAGRKEILDRRIGSNELDAIAICRGYVEVQKQYALEARDGVHQYAQRIVSTRGKRDGLAWQNEDGSWGGPIGEKIARALQQGYSGKAEPYHGYYFKILKGQGPAAPLGKMDFVVKGAMIGGFALVAVPAEYRVTGVKTFIVSHTGIVYQKDLGPASLKIVKQMESYNPDSTWRPTDDSW
jgi:hypothetical protein